MTICSKPIELILGEDITAVLEQVRAFIESSAPYDTKTTLSVVIRKRYSKTKALSALGSLVSVGRHVWNKDGYRFDFKRGKYLWNGTEIYLTPSEAVVMYRFLVLKEALPHARKFLNNARRRLGEQFLKEYTNA